MFPPTLPQHQGYFLYYAKDFKQPKDVFMSRKYTDLNCSSPSIRSGTRYSIHFHCLPRLNGIQYIKWDPEINKNCDRSKSNHFGH